jgi:hypothetical protein
MPRRYYYDHGLPFSEKLGENIKDLLSRIDLNKAALLILDGGVGEGKTTLGVEIADYINGLRGLGKISLKTKSHPQLALGGEDFLKQLRTCYINDLPAIVYDEAGDFNRRGSLTRFNAMINRTFETYRTFKIIVVLCLPSFYVLDSELFVKGIPRLLLRLDNRSLTYGHIRGYSLYRMMYLRKRMDKLVVKSFAYDLVDCNFRGQFLDLEPKRSKALDKISTEGKLNVLSKSEIKLSGILNYADLADKIGRSTAWVRAAVAKLKIKHKRLINRVKYFDRDTLNRLMEFLDEGGLTKE